MRANKLNNLLIESETIVFKLVSTKKETKI